MKSYFILIVNIKIKIAICLVFVVVWQNKFIWEYQRKYNSGQANYGKNHRQVQRNKGKISFYQVWGNWRVVLNKISWEKNKSLRLWWLVHCCCTGSDISSSCWSCRLPWVVTCMEASPLGLPDSILNSIFSTHFHNTMAETKQWVCSSVFLLFVNKI